MPQNDPVSAEAPAKTPFLKGIQGEDRGTNVKPDTSVTSGWADGWQGANLTIAAFFLVSLAGVLLRPALPVDETRYLDVAWEMHLNGNWLVPTKNFAPYSDKPPLLFWLMNLAWMVTGVSDTVARMVGPVFAALTLWLTGRLATRMWPAQGPGRMQAGPQAILALAAMPAFVAFGGLTMFDALLTVGVLWGLLALMQAGTGARSGWLWLGAALAFGGVAKGPVILVHLLPAALTLPLWHPARPGWKQSLKGVGIAIATGLVIAGLWVVPAALFGGTAYRQAILWTQSAGRMADSFAHARGWWFYLMLLPGLAFPWIWIPKIWTGFARLRLSDPGIRLCLIWAGTAFVAFSLFSGKQAHYLIPELPAFAILASRAFAGRRLSLVISLLPIGVLSLWLILGSAGIIPLHGVMTLMHPRPALLAAGIFVIALILGAQKWRGATGAVVLSLGLVLTANLVIGTTAVHSHFDSKALGEALRPFDGNIAFAGQEYNAEFGFAGRLTKPVDLPEETELATWAAAHPGGVIVGRIDRIDPGWAPSEKIAYRNGIYGLWVVPANASKS